MRACVRARVRVLIVSLSAAKCSANRQKAPRVNDNRGAHSLLSSSPFPPPHGQNLFQLFYLWHPVQDQVLGESTMMIGDCKTRMENAFNDLLAAVVRARTLPPKDNFPPHANASLSLHARREGGEKQFATKKRK